MSTEILLSLFVGLGLAAATGFRVFVPPLILCLAARGGHLELSSGFSWLASDAALVIFAVATVLEIVAYYVPWVDNLLDTLATPAAVVAGVVVSASVFGELSPLLRWTLAILAGGGLATIFQGLTAGTRQISSLTTGGLGNPLVSTAEVGASAALAGLAVVLPVAAFLAVVALLWFTARRLLGRRRRRRLATG